MSFFSEVEKAIEREFQKWTEKAFGPAESDDLLLVHRAILEEVERQVQTVQRGKRIFPYNHLRVRLVSPDAARRALFQSALAARTAAWSRTCANAWPERGLRHSRRICGGDRNRGRPATERFRDRCTITARPRPVAAAPAGWWWCAARRMQESFALDRPRTNIGRKAELTDSAAARDPPQRRGVRGRRGRGQRHGVARATPTSLGPRASEYRICDDSSEYGTRIFRDGRSIEVPPGGYARRAAPARRRDLSGPRLSAFRSVIRSQNLPRAIVKDGVLFASKLSTWSTTTGRSICCWT